MPLATHKRIFITATAATHAPAKRPLTPLPRQLRRKTYPPVAGLLRNFPILYAKITATRLLGHRAVSSLFVRLVTAHALPLILSFSTLLLLLSLLLLLFLLVCLPLLFWFWAFSLHTALWLTFYICHWYPRGSVPIKLSESVLGNVSNIFGENVNFAAVVEWCLAKRIAFEWWCVVFVY